MSGPGGYERLQIESVLQAESHGGIEDGVGLFLMPAGERMMTVHDVAVLPAMRRNGLNIVEPVEVIGSESQLRDVTRWLRAAQVIVADVSWLNPDLMYVLGLSHGLRRCPLLIYQEGTELPFNLYALRFIEYKHTPEGLIHLRNRLDRAIRVLLTAEG
jgi:hypothetical protein